MQDEIVEVATYLPGGSHRGIHIEAFTIGEDTGYHRFLEVSGKAQLALDGRLLCRRCL